MKVILKKDVAKLGKRHTVLEVPDGYALNKLIPQGMVVPASAENLKQISHIKAKVSAHLAADESAYLAALTTLATKSITLTVEANAQGHLFKAIKANEIYEALVTEGITAVPVSAITLTHPIKSCGEHTIELNFHTHKDTITITIVAK